MQFLRLWMLQTRQRGLKTPRAAPAGAGRRRSLTAALASLGATLAMAGAPARSADSGVVDRLAGLLGRDRPVICQDQTYALCAGASCFVFNDVAYCTCDVMKRNSISSPFKYGAGNTICTLNGQGANNGYMASTFSLPPALEAPYGTKALYKCPRTSVAAYAKCDGGLCFTSTSGHVSLGSNTPLGNHQITCACPVEAANPLQGLEIIGPYPCQKSFLTQVCDRKFANGDTGSTLYDGTSIGSTEIGARLLDGDVPPLNTCP